MIMRTVVALAALASFPAFAGQSQTGAGSFQDLPPEVRFSADFSTPHPSLLSPEQQRELDRTIERQHRQQLAEWSDLLGGEQAAVQPTPGAGFGTVHPEQ